MNGSCLSDVEPDAFRAAMAHYPTGVTVVTTHGADGRPYGFTASSFCSVSLRPPLVLVCLAHCAASQRGFQVCDRFAVSVLGEGQTDIAMRFATRRPDKFDTDQIVAADGLLSIRDAVVVMGCRLFARHEAGDHTVIIGRVDRLSVTDLPAAVYVDRGFRELRAPTA